MEYKESDLARLKEYLLKIINEVIRICKEENINYFVIGGTALGAVRHAGFIPWDDDFDIGMMRKDYEHFLKIAPQKLSSSFFLQHYSTEPNTPFYFAKVRMSGTLFMEEYCAGLNIHQGIFIDIFPYDNLPVSVILQKIQYWKTFFYSELFISKSTAKMFSEAQKGFKFFQKKTARILLHYLLKPVSKKYIYRLLDKENKRYNHCKADYLSFVKYPFLKIRKENVISLSTIMFEEISMSCCHNINEYLASHFGGDYMRLPPIEKRVNHRPIHLEFETKK